MGQLANEIDSIINYRKEKKEVAAERSKIMSQMASDNAAKQNLLKKALAKQRAVYGASGMSGKGMTEEAVLKRLREEAEEPFKERETASREKLSKTKVKKRNLLKSLTSNFDKVIGGI